MTVLRYFRSKSLSNFLNNRNRSVVAVSGDGSGEAGSDIDLVNGPVRYFRLATDTDLDGVDGDNEAGGRSLDVGLFAGPAPKRGRQPRRRRQRGQSGPLGRGEKLGG